MRAVADARQLRSLQLRSGEGSSAGGAERAALLAAIADAAAALPRLRLLALDTWVALEADSAAFIARLRPALARLAVLRLTCCDLEAPSGLAAARGLRELAFEQDVMCETSGAAADASFAFGAALRGMPRLETLSLASTHNCAVGDVLRGLAHAPSLTRLHMGCASHIDDATAVTLGAALCALPALRHLDISTSGIADVAPLASVLGAACAGVVGTALTTLSMARNTIGSANAAALGALLARMPSLVELDMDGCQLGASPRRGLKPDAPAPQDAAGFAGLCEGLAALPRLERLRLRYNGLERCESGALAGALRRLPALRALQCSHNWLGRDGVAVVACALAAAFRRNAGFHLRLHDNDLDDADALAALAAVTARAPSMRVPMLRAFQLDLPAALRAGRRLRRETPAQKRARRGGYPNIGNAASVAAVTVAVAAAGTLLQLLR
jgi:hypothetical protein